MRLRTAEIDRYGPLYDCRPSCDEGVTVLSGPNEAGKTLYLEAVLQLLEPDVADIMDPKPRVGDPPTGRVVVEYGDDQFECDGDTSVSSISGIEPRHLQSVFVVQDNDLALPSDQEYYTSLIEKLGDIHTSEINAIQSELKDRGRLTDTRLNISSDQSHNHAGTIHDNAASLAEEIRDYTDRIESDGLDELDAKRLRLKRELGETEAQLEVQKEARTVAEYERLSGQLETYRSTSERLADLEAFDRDTLDDLHELRNDLKRDRDELSDLESEIESTANEIEEKAERLDDLETQMADLERRESAVEEARSALETFRDRQEEAAGAERRLTLTTYTTVAGILATGGVGIAGAVAGSLPALGLGAALLLATILSGIEYHRANKRLTAVETARESVLQTARDAGFDVDNLEAIALAIEDFDGELSRVRDWLTRTDAQLGNAEASLDELRDEKSELEARITEQEDERSDLLASAGVESIDEYEARVDTREEVAPEQRTARQSLVDQFGEPDADDAAQKAASWERELEELVADVDVDEVDADAFDEAELEALERKVERLGDGLAELVAQLEDHDDTLDRFDRQARELDTQPFIGRSVGLDSRSKEGLEMLASDLDDVVEQIETDAELSRKALDVFNRIEAEEEQKLTDLFDPDGPASETFKRVTGGRYSEVAYDAEAHEIVVERRDGRTLTPDKLSHGTRDQLYFATRVSLAQQLLGSDPGFLLLDDPFLAADPERLRLGFETLQTLADDGWQILYLTAKEEVSDTMVAEYDLESVQIDSIS